MRLLLDENLSEALLPRLADLYPESLHLRALEGAGASDRRAWDLARQHQCLLVTRDEDFVRLSMALGAPPKVVWLSIQNPSNAELVRLLRERHGDLERFAGHEDATFLIIEQRPEDLGRSS